MSEHVKNPNFMKFGKGYGQPFTVKNQDGQSDEMSKEARQSEVTKVSAVAMVSPPLPVPETSRSIQNFYMIYDKLYAEFREELVHEYA